MKKHISSSRISDAITFLAPALGIVIPLGLATFVIPLLGSEALTQTLLEALINIVAVVGLYVFIGNSGIMSFGHVAFMAIGAYAGAWQTCCSALKPIVMPGLPDFLLQNTLPNLPATLIAGLLAAVVAAISGAVVLRLRGIAISIASFALLFIVNVIYSNADRYTQGVSSIVGLPAWITPQGACLWASGAIVVALLFQNSRFGLTLRASREDEVAALASGIDVYRMRLVAFVISAFLLGVAGALYGSWLGTISVDTFFLDMTFRLVAMLVVGGVRSLAGAVVGVVVISAASESLRRLQDGLTVAGAHFAVPAGFQGIVLAILMLTILVYRRQGIVGAREATWPLRWLRPKVSQVAPTAARVEETGNF